MSERLASARARAAGLGRGGWTWLASGLTPGQQWTAALAVFLSILLVLFGLPTRIVVGGGQAAGAETAIATAPRPSPLPAAAATPPAAPPLGAPLVSVTPTEVGTLPGFVRADTDEIICHKKLTA